MAAQKRRQMAWPEAASAYASALALGPEDPGLLFRAGRAWVESGRSDRAVPLLERAGHLSPRDRRIPPMLARARREADESTPAR